MASVLPLLKRKKAAATCTLSLTSVSVHRSAIPFPSSDDIPEIPTLASTSSNSALPPALPPAPANPRPRQRTHAALPRRKRCALGVDSEPPSTLSSPRKRARKAGLSSAPTLYPPLPSPPKSAPKRNTIAAALGFASGPLTGDLRFLCNVYRSIAWTRLKRDFANAERKLLDAPAMMMDVDMDSDDASGREMLSDLDEQEAVFMDRLRSYLIFHEINPQWLDVTPLLSTTSSWVDDMEIDDSQDSLALSTSTSPSPSPSPPPPLTLPLLPINPQPQIIASLLFRYRHRVKSNSSSIKSRLLAEAAQAQPGPKRRTPRSPLASMVS